MSYTRVEVVSDTPEWEEERRGSVGASEVAAVMGLSKWATALDIYKSKHGVDVDFDPILGFIGHESEPIMHKWVTRFSGLSLDLQPGFMARSTTLPFIHASFDRVAYDPFLTVQMKTAHHYTGHHWDEGIPTDIRVQVQAEMFVGGTERALVVVWIGGREFRMFWEQRDDRFINEQMIPALKEFWARVEAHNPPDPTTLSEVSEVWPSEEASVEADEVIFELAEQLGVHRSDIRAMEAEAEQMKLTIALFMQQADTLTCNGKRILSNKTQKGRQSFDKAALEADHPDLVAAYTRQGADFKVMRALKEKKK